MNTPFSTDPIFDLSEDDQLFTKDLNRAFCAVSHVSERLTDILEDSRFSDKRSYIDKITDVMRNQSTLLEKIFEMIGKKPDFDKCGTLINYMEETFDKVQTNANRFVIRDLTMSNYVLFISDTIKSSFDVLNFLSNSAENHDLNLLINELGIQFAAKFPTNE